MYSLPRIPYVRVESVEVGEAIREPHALLLWQGPFRGRIKARVAVSPKVPEVKAVIEIPDQVLRSTWSEERGRAGIARAQALRVDVQGLAEDYAQGFQRRAVD
jgi:hypothetical protein